MHSSAFSRPLRCHGDDQAHIICMHERRCSPQSKVGRCVPLSSANFAFLMAHTEALSGRVALSGNAVTLWPKLASLSSFIFSLYLSPSSSLCSRLCVLTENEGGTLHMGHIREAHFTSAQSRWLFVPEFISRLSKSVPFNSRGLFSWRVFIPSVKVKPCFWLGICIHGPVNSESANSFPKKHSPTQNQLSFRFLSFFISLFIFLFISN